MLYEVASTLLPGIGDKLSKVLISYCGSAEAIFTLPVGKLEKIPGVGKKTVSIIRQHSKDALRKSEVLMDKCSREKIQLLHYTSADYPYRLKQLEDAPALLYSKGNIPFNNRRTVAIVGTRKATEYGRQVTEDLVKQLAPYNPVIISGLAYGIDIAAHKAALKQNLSTVAVLAGGLDLIYPSLHKDTAVQMQETGGILGESKPGTKPDYHLFPQRNRIIAGLADAVVVVEAAGKGGALITADIAYTYEKILLAVPGNLGNELSAGCNQLIKSRKAEICTSAEDLAYHAHWDKAVPAQEQPVFNLELFSEAEQQVLKVLLRHGEGLQVDELSWKSQVGLNALASLLLTLELQGFVTTLPGKRYKVRKPR